MNTHPLVQVEYLLKCLKDPNKDMRYAAARTLGEYGDERAIIPLTQALADEAAAVRAAAARALGELADNRAIEPLLELLKDPNWEVQVAVCTALASFPQDLRAKAAAEKYQTFLANFPYSHRKFVYCSDPAQIKAYLVELGYQTEERYDRDNVEAIGFRICNTTVELGYDLVIAGRVVGRGNITVFNTSETTQGDIAKAERSFKLYLKLYRRFRNKT